MPFVYYLTVFIINCIYHIKAYDSFSNELIFNLDCNKRLVDKSASNIFITSYGVSLTRDRNGQDEMACTFANPKTYLKMKATFLPYSQMTITFWFKMIALTKWTMLSLHNDIKGFSIIYDNVNGELQLIDKSPTTTIGFVPFNNYNWNQITISLSTNKVVFALNKTQIEKTHPFSSFSTDYSLYIGIESDNSPSISGGYIDDFKVYKNYYGDQSLNLTQLIIENYCEDTQAYVDDKCIKCYTILNCETCYNATHCAKCNSGFALTNNSNCSCQKESCSECSYDGSCYKCNDGYQLNDNKNCVLNNCSNLDYCIKCVNDTCLNCIGNYLITNGKCELPSAAITGVVITFLFVVIIIWVVILVLVRPKLIT